MSTDNNKVIVVIGPTATGKSDLAVALARKFNGEVVSADSRQVYTGLDIGTGKVTAREMRGVRHHLLDVADPRRQFSAERFRTLALAAVADIAERGKLPIICGGSGFYIDALFGDSAISDVPPNPRLRARLADKTPKQLLSLLKKADPKRWKTMSASASERNNARRIIRAIEIAKGRPWTRSPRFNLGPKHENPASLQPLYIGLQTPSETLRQRIHKRLIKRLNQGMIEEARKLHRKGLSWKRMNELGLEYRHLALYLQKKIGKEEMIRKLETEIWHYAKRQMAWFKRNKNIRWFALNKNREIEKKVRAFI